MLRRLRMGFFGTDGDIKGTFVLYGPGSASVLVLR